MKPNFTSWFKATVKPVREGVYQRKLYNSKIYNTIVYSYWDGTNWYLGGSSPHAAVDRYQINYVSVFQEVKWRGIAHKPT